jgi:hypothetical protein
MVGSASGPHALRKNTLTRMLKRNFFI